MNKHSLLKVCRIQEIDLFFTERGFSRSYIFKTIIYPNFFISKATYYVYLGINAKSKLREKGINWKKELDALVPVNYTQLMKELSGKSLFHDLTKSKFEDYDKMVKEGCKH